MDELVLAREAQPAGEHAKVRHVFGSATHHVTGRDLFIAARVDLARRPTLSLYLAWQKPWECAAARVDAA